MGKIGSYDYPDIQFGTLLKAIEILVTKFSGEVKDAVFASALGHKSEKSGGYLMKLADLRKYGLLEKRGISPTTRAKQIVKFLTPQERQTGINEAVFEIRLWKELYERLKTSQPTAEDFKLQLHNLTGDRDNTSDNYQTIRNIYMDAMNNYSNTGEITANNNGENAQTVPSPEQKPKSQGDKVPENLIVLKSGTVDITLPRNEANIKILKSILDGLPKIE